MPAFKPNPKKNDIEERAVIALNTTNEAFQALIAKIENRPKETHLERRIYLDSMWSDWKKVTN